MDKPIDKVMRYLAPLVMVVAAVMIIAFLIDRTREVSKDNNVYVRYIACALSVDPDIRTPEVIAGCWDHVIEEADHDVHRYDEQSDLHPWLKQQ